jgi:GT2 family glycosyltransferase
MNGLTIILVNYNNKPLLHDCLKSIFLGYYPFPLEVIVVDNFSSDDSEEMIKEHFSRVKWFRLTSNQGFARANNYGIRQSNGDAVLLLNTDTIVQDDAITNAYFRLMSSSHIACGVQLLNKDGSPQISGNYFVKGSLNYLLPLPYLGSFVRSLGLFFNFKKPSILNTDTDVEVDWINGAFIMVKMEAIKNIGLLDEDFFLYAEEAEWCHRLKRAGSLCIFGDLHVTHLQGETANLAFGSTGKGYYNLYDRKGLQIMLSNLLRIRKQNGVFWYLFHMFVYSLAVLVFWGLGTVEYICRPKSFKDFTKLAKGFTFNMVRLWTFFYKIILSKKYFYKVL